MRKLEDALVDLGRALILQPDDVLYKRARSKILFSLGRCDQALVDVQDIGRIQKQDEPELEDISKCAFEIEQATNAFMQEDWGVAIHYLDSVIPRTEKAIDLAYMRAKSALGMKDYYGAVSDTGRILKMDGGHIDALQLRGEAYTRLAEHDMAVKHFREGLKFDPEHKGCKAGHKFVKKIMKYDKKGNDASASDQHKEAIGFWWQAINHDKT